MRFTNVVPGVASPAALRVRGVSSPLFSVIAGGLNMLPYFGLERDKVWDFIEADCCGQILVLVGMTSLCWNDESRWKALAEISKISTLRQISELSDAQGKYIQTFRHSFRFKWLKAACCWHVAGLQMHPTNATVIV